MSTPISQHTTTSTLPTAYILWGKLFDEEMAVTFIKFLRSRRVNLLFVGIHGRVSAGEHGVILSTDYTLSDLGSVAPTPSSMIIPCHSPQIRAIENDPRIQILLQQAHKNNAPFITGRLHTDDYAILPTPSHRIRICNLHETYKSIAEELFLSTYTKDLRSNKS